MSTTETPDWLNPVPFGDVGHGQLPGNPYQRDTLSEDQLRQMRKQLLESVLAAVVQSVRGLFVPGPFGAAFDQLQEWAEDMRTSIREAALEWIVDFEFRTGLNIDEGAREFLLSLRERQKQERLDWISEFETKSGLEIDSGAAAFIASLIQALRPEWLKDGVDWVADFENKTGLNVDEGIRAFLLSLRQKQIQERMDWISEFEDKSGLEIDSGAAAFLVSLLAKLRPEWAADDSIIKAIADAAKAASDRAIANFTAILNKWGMTDLADWINDVWATKGTANTANTNANTANALATLLKQLSLSKTKSNTNLVLDPGCEQSSAWFGASQGTIAISTEQFRSGPSSLKYTITASGYPSINMIQHGSDGGQKLVCQPGDTFYAEAWVRANAANVNTKTMIIQFMSSDSTGVGADYVTGTWINTTQTMPTSTGWTKIGGLFTIPAGRDRLTIVLSGDNNGTNGDSYYFDDLVVREVTRTQSIIDQIYQAFNGGTQTGNLITTIKSIIAAINTTSSTAKTNADQALANFTTALNKFGLSTVADWVNDLFGTKGIANTANTNANTAVVNAALAKIAAIGRSANLVSNPGFEDTAGPIFYGNGTYSTEKKRTGNYSIKMPADKPAGSSCWLFTDNSLPASKQCIPGDVFYCEGWYYGHDSNVITANHTVGFYYNAYDTSFGIVGQGWVNGTVQGNATKGAWTKFSGYVTIPANAASFNVSVHLVGDANSNFYYYDDVTVREVTAGYNANTLATAVQAIANAAKVNADQAIANFTAILNKFGFSQIADWINDIFATKGTANTANTNANTANSLANIIKSLTTGKITSGSNLMPNPGFEDPNFWYIGHLVPNTNAKYVRTGTRSVKITANGNYVGGNIVTDNTKDIRIPCSPGDVFYMEAWVRADDANTAATGLVYIQFAGETAPATYSYVTIASTTTPAALKGGWTKLAGTVTVPEGVYNGMFYLFLAPSVAPGNIFYWDDPVVREITEGRKGFDLATAVQTVANAAKANADQAIANFTAILNKFGFSQIADWINDIFATKGTASTANTNANTANTAISVVQNIVNALGTSGNMVISPNFEDTTIQRACYASNSAAPITYSTEEKLRGTRSLKWTAPGGWAGPVLAGVPTSQDTVAARFTVKAGEVYSVKTHIKPHASNATAGFVSLYARAYNSVDGTNNAVTKTIYNNAILPSWQSLDVTYTIPDGYDQLSVFVVSDPTTPVGNTYYLDSVSVREVAEAKAANDLATAVQTIANAAKANADQALANFTSILTKFGLATVADWINDIFATKGTASTANTNANTAIANAGITQKLLEAANKSGANLIPDPSFEDSTFDVDRLNTAAVSGGGTAPYVWSFATDRPRTGSRSLKVVTAGNYAQTILTPTLKSNGYIPVRPGQVFLFSCWAYAATTNTGTNRIENYLELSTTAPNTGINYTAFSGYTNLTNGVWTRVSGYATVPDNGSKFLRIYAFGVRLGNVSGDTFWFDDVELYDVTDAYNAQTTANTAKANADQALANFTSILTKFGLATVADWINDIFATKGTASTANTNASTALANFQAALTKFGKGTVAEWLQDLFDTKGTANTANTAAGTANTNANTAITNIQNTWNNLWDGFNGTSGSTGKTLADLFNRAGWLKSQADKGVTDAGAAQSTANTANTAAGTANTNLQDTWNKLWDGFNGSSGSSGKTLADLFNRAGWLKGQADKGVADASAAQSTANTANTTAGTANTTANTANTAASNAATNIQNTWNNLWDGFNGTSGSTGKTLADLFSRAGWLKGQADKGVTDASAAQSTANTANATANTANTTANTANSTANTANTTASGNSTKIQDTWNNLWDGFNGTSGSTGKTLANLFERAGNVRTRAEKGVTDSAAAQSTANTASTTANTANTTANTANTAASNAATNIQNTWNNLWDGFNGTSGSTGKTLADLFSRAGWLKSQADKGVTDASAAQSTANTAQSTANTANTTANTANTTANTANTAASNAGTNIQNTWNNLWDAFNGTTGSTGKTLAQMFTNAKWVKDRADTGVANAATATTNAATADAKAVAAQSAATTADGKAVSAGNNVQTTVDYITGALSGDTGLTGNPLSAALTALTKTYEDISAHSRAIQELQARRDSSNVKGKLVNVDFSTYSNGALPSGTWTVTYTGSGTSTIQVQNGIVQWVAGNNVARTAKIIHATPTATDFQIIRGTMTSPPEQGQGANAAPRFYAIGRVSADGNSYVWARGYASGLLQYKGDIGCTVNGVETVWASNISLTWSLDMTFVVGVGTNARQYQVYSGSKLVYSHTESGTTSQLGANNRRWGAISEATAGNSAIRQAGKLSGASISDNEAPAVVGSVARMFRATVSNGSMPGGENALGANFFTNVEYESPDIDANTVDGTFTVAEEKAYYINARLWLANAIALGGTGGVALQLYRNNVWSTVAYGNTMLLTTADVGLCGNWIQYLKAGEKVRLATVRGGTNVTPLGGDASGTQTYFSIAGIG